MEDQSTKDIKEIKVEMIKHNQSDLGEFKSINDKLDIHHDIHIRNEENIKNMLVQVTKTNGRVTKLEEVVVNQDKTIALLAQVSSAQHNQYENFVIQQEKNGNGLVTKDILTGELWALKAIVYGGAGLALTALAGALLSQVIIKQ